METESVPPAKHQRPRAAKRNGPPAPDFSCLQGDKISVGDHLSLLCGNNEFLQKVLLSELCSRYFELTTVAKSSSAGAVEVCLAIKPPKRAALNFVTVSLSKGTTPVAACPDTGAEVSLLSTAVLDQAGV